MFMALAIVCDEFFVPALNVITKKVLLEKYTNLKVSLLIKNDGILI